MARRKNVRDPVWSEVQFSDTEWRVLNTRTFQRLRRIHQLGLTMLVFPGATHTRFEHSVGTMFIAGRLSERVKDVGEAPLADDRVEVVRLAALLHDVGHGPFSHVVDAFLEPGGGHEAVGAMIVEQEVDVAAALGSDLVAEVAGLLRHPAARSVERDIVSGPTDADKTDYLMRDSQFAGVRQGMFDVDRLIDQAVRVATPGESMLGFYAGGTTAVESMRLARHHMHRSVYGHRNRLVTDFMLRRGIADALARGLLPEGLLSVPDDAGFARWFDEYRRWDDWRMMATLSEVDGVAGLMFRRLMDHDLLKLLVSVEDRALHDGLGLLAASRLVGADPDAALLDAIASEVAAYVGEDPAEVIVQVIDPKRSLGGLTDAASFADEDVMIVGDENRLVKLDAVSEIFSRPQTADFRRKLLVYDPLGRKADPARARSVEEMTVRLLRERLEAADG
jgi:uncharacterized protein